MRSGACAEKLSYCKDMMLYYPIDGPY